MDELGWMDGMGWVGWKGGWWAENEGGGLGMGGKLTGMSVKKNSVKKIEKKWTKRKKKYIGDAASVIPIANGVGVGIAYITSVIVIARVVIELLFFQRKLAF